MALVSLQRFWRVSSGKMCAEHLGQLAFGQRIAALAAQRASAKSSDHVRPDHQAGREA
jgi:hypothetical protein